MFSKIQYISEYYGKIMSVLSALVLSDKCQKSMRYREKAHTNHNLVDPYRK